MVWLRERQLVFDSFRKTALAVQGRCSAPVARTFDEDVDVGPVRSHPCVQLRDIVALFEPPERAPVRYLCLWTLQEQLTPHCCLARTKVGASRTGGSKRSMHGADGPSGRQGDVEPHNRVGLTRSTCFVYDTAFDSLESECCCGTAGGGWLIAPN